MSLRMAPLRMAMVGVVPVSCAVIQPRNGLPLSPPKVALCVTVTDSAAVAERQFTAPLGTVTSRTGNSTGLVADGAAALLPTMLMVSALADVLTVNPMFTGTVNP